MIRDSASIENEHVNTVKIITTKSHCFGSGIGSVGYGSAIAGVFECGRGVTGWQQRHWWWWVFKYGGAVIAPYPHTLMHSCDYLILLGRPLPI